MAKAKDLTGQRFGRLVVVDLNEEESSKPRKNGKHTTKRRYWNCLCDCGNTCVVREKSLIEGDTKSCGCLMKEIASTIGNNTQEQYIEFKERYLNGEFNTEEIDSVTDVA